MRGGGKMKISRAYIVRGCLQAPPATLLCWVAYIKGFILCNTSALVIVLLSLCVSLCMNKKNSKLIVIWGFFSFSIFVAFTWMTLMLRPVSLDSCSLMCLVGFGVAAKAAFRVSSCLAFIVVRGPRRFPTALCSSFSLLHVSLSDKCPFSDSFPSSCGSWESGDRLGSLHVVTVIRIRQSENATTLG